MTEITKPTRRAELRPAHLERLAMCKYMVESADHQHLNIIGVQAIQRDGVPARRPRQLRDHGSADTVRADWRTGRITPGLGAGLSARGVATEAPGASATSVNTRTA